MNPRGTSSRRCKRLRKAGLILLIVAGPGLGVAIFFSYFLAGERLAHVAVGRTSHARAQTTPTASPLLRVITLNLAHGRKDGTHQLLQSAKRIRSNLDDIVAALDRLEPDVVALQEADGPSFWSGGFDHVEYLAESSSFGYFARAGHGQGMGLSYGTAVVSKPPMNEARLVTFAPSPPSPSKGFLVATIDWMVEAGKTATVDIISVHLDFSRDSVRESQIQDIIENVAPRARPLIIMGDFNCAWTDEGSLLKVLARELDLEAFQPEASTLVTFPLRGLRIDWILISSELEFRSHRIVADKLSDHLAVIAEIALAR